MNRIWTRTLGPAAVLRPLTTVAALLTVGVLSACGGTSNESSASAGGDSSKLTLVAYSTPEEAFRKIIPAFNRTPEGEGVGFDQSYASSGEQSRAVEGGLPADVVDFSLEPDMTRLVDAGLVDEDWNRNEHDGFVTDSVVVFMVRKGNPEDIQTWDDLIKPGIEVIEPNPFTSGGAKWNIMAAYGAQLEAGKSEQEAQDYLTQLFEHVPVLDKSARESLQTFASGKGDVLLGYENEAILAQAQGEELDYIVPDETILIENPVAVVNESQNIEKAQAFVDYLYTPEAQGLFAETGYRPVVEGVESPHDFPTPPELFEIDKFGGWGEVNDTFFDPESGVIAEIFKSQGKSTASD
jgi:sulfate/thiosulfate transport system substrate-binding protein